MPELSVVLTKFPNTCIHVCISVDQVRAYGVVPAFMLATCVVALYVQLNVSKRYPNINGKLRRLLQVLSLSTILTMAALNVEFIVRLHVGVIQGILSVQGPIVFFYVTAKISSDMIFVLRIYNAFKTTYLAFTPQFVHICVAVIVVGVVVIAAATILLAIHGARARDFAFILLGAVGADILFQIGLFIAFASKLLEVCWSIERRVSCLRSCALTQPFFMTIWIGKTHFDRILS